MVVHSVFGAYIQTPVSEMWQLYGSDQPGNICKCKCKCLRDPPAFPNDNWIELN